MAQVGCCVLFYISHWQYAAKERVIKTSRATCHCTEVLCWSWLLVFL